MDADPNSRWRQQSWKLEENLHAVMFGFHTFASIEEGQPWISNDLSEELRTCTPDIWSRFEVWCIHAGIAVRLTRNGDPITCLFLNSKIPRQWIVEEVKLLQNTAERIWSLSFEPTSSTNGLLPGPGCRPEHGIAAPFHEPPQNLQFQSPAIGLINRADGLISAQGLGHNHSCWPVGLPPRLQP
jgi:hypothetical protein